MIALCGKRRSRPVEGRHPFVRLVWVMMVALERYRLSPTQKTCGIFYGVGRDGPVLVLQRPVGNGNV